MPTASSTLIWTNNVISPSFYISHLAIDTSTGKLYGIGMNNILHNFIIIFIFILNICIDGSVAGRNLLNQINTDANNAVTNLPFGSADLTTVYAIAVFSPTVIYMSSSSSRIVKWDGTSIASFGNLGGSGLSPPR